MKYELTDEVIVVSGVKLHRIKALKDFSFVKKGELGGFVEKESNLDQHGNAWVSGDTWVFGNARVSGNAWVSGDIWVFGNARIFGNAWVSGNARVSDDARIFGNARVDGNALVSGNARVDGNALVSGNARVFGNARVSNANDITVVENVGSENGTLTAFNSSNGIYVNRGCFFGSLDDFEEAVNKTHGDNKTAKEYRILIEYIKLRLSKGDKGNE